MNWVLVVGVAVSMVKCVVGGIPASICSSCSDQHCLLPTEDCRDYYHCELVRTGVLPIQKYRITRKNCAFGTHFNPSLGVCDMPRNVPCPNDKCKIYGKDYSYPADNVANCRAYWTCKSGYPEARCCDRGSSFSVLSQKCVRNDSCEMNCPRKKDACAGKFELAFSDDDNCLTHWNCSEGGSPQPKCCKQGEVFDVQTDRCITGFCKDICPIAYRRDLCKIPNFDSYKLNDDYCRTYMKCGRRPGIKNKRLCCPSGQIYDPVKKCRDKTEEEIKSMQCSDECPDGYFHECLLRPLPDSNLTAFYHTSVGPSQNTSCATGTLFSSDICGCGTTIKDPSLDNSCNMKVDVLFDYPNLIRKGQDKTYIKITGTPKAGEKDGKLTAFKFEDYHMEMETTVQVVEKFFLNIKFRPTEVGRQNILASNCGQLGNPNLPTFEMRLIDMGGQYRVVVFVSTDEQPYSSITVTVQLNDFNDCYVIYDGQTLTVHNFNSVGKLSKSWKVSGQVKMPSSPLTIGGCNYSEFQVRRASFVGDISKFRWTYCLKDDFFPVMPDSGI